MSNIQSFYICKDDPFSQQAKVLHNFNKSLEDKLKDTDVCIEMKDIKKAPTDPQRKYIFGVVYKHIQQGLYDLGNDDYKTSDDVHLFMKLMLKYYEKKTIKTKAGEVTIVVYKSISTRYGDKEEVKRYIDECISWASKNLYIVVPDPSDYGLKYEI